nr:hypothetical protein [Tanacetum cinerariifolium]
MAFRLLEKLIAFDPADQMRVTCGYPWPELEGNNRDFGMIQERLRYGKQTSDYDHLSNWSKGEEVGVEVGVEGVCSGNEWVGVGVDFVVVVEMVGDGIGGSAVDSSGDENGSIWDIGRLENGTICSSKRTFLLTSVLWV